MEKRVFSICLIVLVYTGTMMSSLNCPPDQTACLSRIAVFAAALVFALVAILPAQAVPARVSVACDNNYPPYCFLDAEGQARGILPDQWAAWSKATGIPVDFRGYSWAEAIRVFEAHGADILDTVFETQERSLKYDFSPPYATIEVPIFIHKSISGIHSAADLKGFRIAVKDGDASIEALAALGIESVDRYPDYEAIIEAATRLDTRIFCVDKPPALYYLYKAGADKDFRIVFTLDSGAFHRAVLKGNTALLDLVEKGFAGIQKETYASIDQAWLGAPISSRADLRFLGLVLGALLLLLVILSALAWALRRRVFKATTDLREKVAQLEESESRNRAFIAALPDPSFTIDREGKVLAFSASDLSGLAGPPSELLGRKFSDLGFPPLVTAAFFESMNKAFDTRRIGVFEYEIALGGKSSVYEGRVAPLSEDRVLLVSRDVTQKREQEERLKRSLAEKEILLKEIHHRVKNNMQVISSLIALQAESFHDPEDMRLLAETQQRIRSMARLHELLYDSPDMASIGAVEYLESLAWELATGYGSAPLEVSGPQDLRLTIDEAVPFGLIANELASNALKYAYPAGSEGEIRITLALDDARVRLAVQDHGRGLPAGIDPETCKSMGFLLVRSLASQLRGSLSFSRAPGLRVELSFPRTR